MRVTISADAATGVNPTPQSNDDPNQIVDNAMNAMIQAFQDFADGKITYAKLQVIISSNDGIIDQYPQVFDQDPGRVQKIDEYAQSLQSNPPPSIDEMANMAGGLAFWRLYPAPLVPIADAKQQMENDLNQMISELGNYSGTGDLNHLIMRMNLLMTDFEGLQPDSKILNMPECIQAEENILMGPPSPLRGIMQDPTQIAALAKDLGAVLGAVEGLPPSPSSAN